MTTAFIIGAAIGTGAEGMSINHLQKCTEVMY